MAKDETKPVVIYYGRAGAVVRFSTVNADEHEIRACLTGLWCILDERSRLDMIRELAHYHESPNSRLPAVARTIVHEYRRGA